jgi:hypothetical protein
MSDKPAGGKLPLTILLSPEVARRLTMAAEAQRRSAAEVAADLLARHLPRAEEGGGKKGSIPYT